MQIFGKGVGEELNGLSFIIDESLNCSVKYKICLQFCKEITAAGLAQLERLTEEREGHGSLPGVGPMLRVLKELRNEETCCRFPPKVFTPLRGLDDHVKWGPVSMRHLNMVSSISTFMLNSLTLR